MAAPSARKMGGGRRGVYWLLRWRPLRRAFTLVVVGGVASGREGVLRQRRTLLPRKLFHRGDLRERVLAKMEWVRRPRAKERAQATANPSGNVPSAARATLCKRRLLVCVRTSGPTPRRL